MRILQLSDLHFPDSGETIPVPGLTPTVYLKRLVAAVRDTAPDLVVLSGDLAMTGPSDHVYGTLREAFRPVHQPVCVIPGNHDVPGSLGRFFAPPREVVSSGPEHCFAVVVGDRRVLFLDSSRAVVADDALAWLRAEIVAADERVYLFVHHPLMLAGTPFMDRNYPLENRDDVMTVLANCEAGASVFCGHYHCGRDLVRGGVVVHITPSCLFQLDPESDEAVVLPSPQACRVIDIDGSGYRTWIREL